MLEVMVGRFMQGRLNELAWIVNPLSRSEFRADDVPRPTSEESFVAVRPSQGGGCRHGPRKFHALGRRPISKEMAKKLAAILQAPVARFIYTWIVSGVWNPVEAPRVAALPAFSVRFPLTAGRTRGETPLKDDRRIERGEFPSHGRGRSPEIHDSCESMIAANP